MIAESRSTQLSVTELCDAQATVKPPPPCHGRKFRHIPTAEKGKQIRLLM